MPGTPLGRSAIPRGIRAGAHTRLGEVVAPKDCTSNQCHAAVTMMFPLSDQVTTGIDPGLSPIAVHELGAHYRPPLLDTSGMIGTRKGSLPLLQMRSTFETLEVHNNALDELGRLTLGRSRAGQWTRVFRFS